MRERWNVDAAHMLLTGMSDGGTFSYVSGLRGASPFTHLAPVSASFHPFLLEMSEPARIAGLPIYLVHGKLDWMFPIDMARVAHRALAGAGADVMFEVPVTKDTVSATNVTFSQDSGTNFALGTTRVVVMARDETNNATACAFDVTVVDTTPPDLTCPTDLAVEATSEDGAVVLGYTGLLASDAVSIPVPVSDQARNVYAVVNQTEARAGSTAWTAGRTRLGSTSNGGAPAQGITDVPGRLVPLTLERALPAGAAAVVASSNGAAQLDALLVQPLVSSVAVTGPGGASTMYVSSARQSSTRAVVVPKGFVLTQRAFDATGKPVAGSRDSVAAERSQRVTVVAGGFTFVTFVRR